MKTVRSRRVGVLPGAALGALLVVSLAIFGADVAKQFRPPRVAVVDISAVFEGYTKKKDSQAVLEKKSLELKKTLERLEKDYEELRLELQNLKEDSPLYIEKNLEKKEMELRVLQLKNTELKALRETQFDLLREIREEITAEINTFAKAHDIDLVLERQVTAESEGAGVGFRWPIVHFSKPEFDVTREITRILNSKYKRKT